MPRRARPGFPQRSPPTAHGCKWPLAGTFSILRINIQPLDRTCSPYRFKRYSRMDRKSLQDTAPRLPIGVMSQRTGGNIETIRYYEKIGLLPLPARSEGGHRLYGHGHLMRLGFVRRARELGFTLDEIRALLQLTEDRERPCAEAREVAVVHLADIRTKIADLPALEGVLASTQSDAQR